MFSSFSPAVICKLFSRLTHHCPNACLLVPGMSIKMFLKDNKALVYVRSHNAQQQQTGAWVSILSLFSFLLLLSEPTCVCPTHAQRDLAVTVAELDNAMPSALSEESGKVLKRPIRYQSFCPHPPLLNHLSCSHPWEPTQETWVPNTNHMQQYMVCPV